MYPEEAPAPEPMPVAGGGRGRFTRNLEGLIPLILIIIIVAFLGDYFGFWDLPFIGGARQINMLIIGQPSKDLITILNNNKSFISYVIRSADSLEVNPSEQLAQYDIIMLDQHLGATRFDHAVSLTLGKAIEDYVKKGGKLITIMDSGIYRSGGIYGRGVASDVIGWRATFGTTIPVDCITYDSMPSCDMSARIQAVGRLQRVDFDHRIMQGVEFAPAYPPNATYVFSTFDVKPTGNELASIKSETPTGKYFPGIVEGRRLIGKSVYFNYDPAITPSIFEATLEYLR